MAAMAKRATLTINKRMRAWRVAKKMSLRQLGRASGIDAGALCRMETGLRDPRHEDLTKVARALKVSVTVLVSTLPAAA